MNSNPNDPMPEYGTPEYAAWYQRNVGPIHQTPAQAAAAQKHHPVRWLLGGGAAVVAGIVALAIATSGGGHEPGNHVKPAAAAATKQAAAAEPTEDPTTDAPTDDPTSDDSTDDGNTYDTEATESPSDDAPVFEPIGSVVDYTTTDALGEDESEAHIQVTEVGSYTGPLVQDEYGSNDAPHYGTFRVFKVTMRVLSGSVDDIDSTSFRWETPGGHVYDESEGNSITSGFDPDDELTYNGASAGQTISGQLIFDVPAGAGKLEIVNYDSSVVGGWTVSR